ncbi:hypothetical protein [Cupriavidus sp. UYPR2.512]|uniref:hypothetical protein n=1 Tax=Cupriavidus sp. UYPR2.512 TaxID=1080187 RepID=UPI00035FA88E|nr:hypothetical protein [Cupriavidus sp. UYPR2.512]UIF90880.1 hypothetical protein KAF44_32345 [Cupriavidus necator]
MIDAPNTLERLATAMGSRDLSIKRGTSDVDYIIALGMTARANSAASAMVNLHLAQNPAAYKEAERAAVAVARHLNLKRRWKLKVRDLIRISGTALKYYICPVCPHCFGRKFDLFPGTQRLSDKICRPCHGTGKRPLPLQHGREIAEIIGALENIERVAEDAVRTKVRGRVS